jgi:hypothetical protein
MYRPWRAAKAAPTFTPPVIHTPSRQHSQPQSFTPHHANIHTPSHSHPITPTFTPPVIQTPSRQHSQPQSFTPHHANIHNPNTPHHANIHNPIHPRRPIRLMSSSPLRTGLLMFLRVLRELSVRTWHRHCFFEIRPTRLNSSFLTHNANG